VQAAFFDEEQKIEFDLVREDIAADAKAVLG